MWKPLCAAFAAALLLSACGRAFAQSPQAVIIKSGTSEIVSPARLAETVGVGEVLIFGEYHDRPELHVLEEQTLRALYERYGRLAISLEMFERDVQPVLDEYLQGAISETDFLRRARPWPRYASDYRPLVEFGRKRRLPVLAGNIPRGIAAHYVRTGGFAPEHQQYLPRAAQASADAYREAFFAAMTVVANEGMKAPPERYDAMFRAQCLKDDAMAQSIADYLAAHPGDTVYHVQGAFHGRGGLGAVEKLRALQPTLRITLVSAVVRERGLSLVAMAEKYAADGDYLAIIDESQPADAPRE